MDEEIQKNRRNKETRRKKINKWKRNAKKAKNAKKETKETSTWRNKIRIAIEQMRIKNLTIPLFILSLIITILSPSLFNKIVIVFYLLLFAKKYLITNRKANLVGTIEDAQGVPLENAIIKLSNPATAETVALATSNTKGKYALYYEPGQYYISVTKTGYVWYRESGSMGFEEVTLQEKRVSYPITLTSVETIMESL